MTVAAWRTRLMHELHRSPDDSLTLGIVAPGVWRRRKRLTQLLGPNTRLKFGASRTVDALLGWGFKGTGRTLAQDRQLPYIAVEDAFIARLGSDEKRFGLLGIITDPVGVYYDAREPSLVEELIAASTAKSVATSTHDLLQTIVRDEVAKFNSLDTNRLRSESSPSGPYDAIVVDQIAGDLSIAGGMASDADFLRMLEAAIDENSNGRVAVKLHPYDGIGDRTGHLRGAANRWGVDVIPNAVPWLRCVQNTKRVYVVSSNAGLEALIAGCSVTCFGVPFFGGWGLTDDRQRSSRRTKNPSLEQLCHAVYVQYGQYWNPALRRPGTALELGRTIVAHQRHQRMLGDGVTLHGVPKLKHSHIRPFIPRGARLTVRKSAMPKDGCEPQAVWASRMHKTLGAENAWENRDAFHVEDGFLRSAGLGADLIRPNSLVFDKQGIYFDPSRVSDLEQALETMTLDDEQRRRGGELVRQLTEARISKYNVGQASTLTTEGKSRVILVPGQVANDASVLRGGGAIQSNAALLETVRTSNPDAFILYKPHPDVEQAGRPGFVADAFAYADKILDGVSALSAIEACDEVHTLTSLLGFEALLRGKRVTTYGQPFYAGWGLTEEQVRLKRRTRNRSVDELAYIALVAYPLYVSPLSHEPCTAEDVIEALSSGGRGTPSLPFARSSLRLWRKLKSAPDYLR